MTAPLPQPLPPPLPLPVAYPVWCARGALAGVAEVVRRCAPAHRVAVITDTTVAAHHAASVTAQFPPETTRLLVIPPGEQEKTRARWAALTDELLAWGAGRDTTVVALGGGVVTDLAGFVAATYLRGIPVVQVPTTLLAMVDAAIGGKTAVDTPLGKNLVGAFHNPAAVVVDPDVLQTLPEETLRAGVAEMLKHGVIADAAYFDALLQALPSLAAEGGRAAALPALIAGSLHIKADVVAEDTREGGLRQILNFGHTLAHAIERELAFGIAHGEAVAIGMVLEARLAERMGVATPGVAVAVQDAVRRAGLPDGLPAGVTPAAVVRATHGDKKVRDDQVRYALPRAIGAMDPADGRWGVAVPDAVVEAVLQG
ncbi:MAG: 3-dehydroquinate synthase [Gemmatimonadetes bacterium]|nr:3-dehydroquinate synthase [Gemmatimonadota bacterium]